MPTISQLIVWIVIGLLAGSLVGLVARGDRKGFGLFRNLALGLGGALIGGVLFRLFGLFPQLDQIAISLRDIVSAVIGSLIILMIVFFWSRDSGSS